LIKIIVAIAWIAYSIYELVMLYLEYGLEAGLPFGLVFLYLFMALLGGQALYKAIKHQGRVKKSQGDN
jgi:hypothetical protein